MGMHKSGGTKARGRNSVAKPVPGKDLGPQASKPNPPITVKAEANRPVSSGGKHRGDRRDMHRQYTGTTKHAARGQTGRIDRATRKD
jgi:hypothetical protein